MESFGCRVAKSNNGDVFIFEEEVVLVLGVTKAAAEGTAVMSTANNKHPPKTTILDGGVRRAGTIFKASRKDGVQFIEQFCSRMLQAAELCQESMNK